MKRVLMKLQPKVKILDDFYVFDTETGIRNPDGSIQWHLNARPESFIFGVIYGKNYTKVIHDLKEFHETLLDPRFKNKYVFAHNLEYDGGVLYGNVLQFDPRAIFNGRLICFTNGNCKFADSMNIFKTSVAKLGDMIGIKKPDLGDANLYSISGVTASEINRCITDCIIVYEALIRIFEDSGDIKITQASLSMTYFRRFHLAYNIEHNENTKYFWSSYYGGRTEAFKIGKTNAKVIDANSMYPFTMRECIFPNPRTLMYDLRVTKQKLKKYLDDYEGCIFCTVEHDETSFGYLPVKHDGKLCFPIGKFSGCWNFNEIRFALESGKVRVIKIEKVVYGERMQSPFISYVDTLYAKRFKADNEFEKYRIKIFMNSLYGKFAQRIDQESIYLEDYVKQYDEVERAQADGTFIKLSLFNEDRRDAILITKCKKKFDISYSIPSFASYITSAARVHLLKQMLAMEKCGIVYCDTDSIFFEIDPGIKNGSGLGQWKVEDKIVTEIRGLKNYRYIENGKEARKLKGVPDKAEQISENSYQYFNLVKTKEALRRNLDAGVKMKRQKTIKNTYTKRIVFPDGETKPLYINESN